MNDKVTSRDRRDELLGLFPGLCENGATKQEQQEQPTTDNNASRDKGKEKDEGEGEGEGDADGGESEGKKAASTTVATKTEEEEEEDSDEDEDLSDMIIQLPNGVVIYHLSVPVGESSLRLSSYLHITTIHIKLTYACTQL